MVKSIFLLEPGEKWSFRDSDQLVHHSIYNMRIPYESFLKFKNIDIVIVETNYHAGPYFHTSLLNTVHFIEHGASRVWEILNLFGLPK